LRIRYFWLSGFLEVVQLSFQVIQFLDQLNVLALIAFVITQVQYNVGQEKYQQDERTIFKQPDLIVQLKHECRIILLIVEVKREQKYQQVKHSDNRVKNKPVSFHTRSQ
jgi:hypothetical protein